MLAPARKVQKRRKRGSPLRLRGVLPRLLRVDDTRVPGEGTGLITLVGVSVLLGRERAEPLARERGRRRGS